MPADVSEVSVYHTEIAQKVMKCRPGYAYVCFRPNAEILLAIHEEEHVVSEYQDVHGRISKL